MTPAPPPSPTVPSATPPTRTPGRPFTIVFASLIVLTVVAGEWLRRANESDREGAARLAVAPLEFTLRLECAPPGGEPVPFKSGDTCPAGSALRVTLDKVDAEVAELSYAWVTEASDTLGVLPKTLGLTTGLSVGTGAGERFLVVVASQAPSGRFPLSMALEPLPKGSVARHRAGALRGHSATLVTNAIHARSIIVKVVVP